MTPDEARQWTDGRINDLAQRVDIMQTAVNHVARHAVKIDSIEDDIREGRAAIMAIAKTCEDHTRRVEQKLDEQVKAAQANKWSPTQWAAILGPTLTALIGAAALILTGGPK